MEVEKTEVPSIEYYFFEGKCWTIVSRQRGSTNFFNKPARFYEAWSAMSCRDLNLECEGSRARANPGRSRIAFVKVIRMTGWVTAQSRTTFHLAEIQRDFAKRLSDLRTRDARILYAPLFILLQYRTFVARQSSPRTDSPFSCVIVQLINLYYRRFYETRLQDSYLPLDCGKSSREGFQVSRFVRKIISERRELLYRALREIENWNRRIVTYTGN